MKKNSEQSTPEATTPLKRMCCAFGCPELGTISPSNVGSAEDSQWFCRFHFGETSDRWPEITRSRRLFWNDYVEPQKPKVVVTQEYIEKVREELIMFANSFGRT